MRLLKLFVACILLLGLVSCSLSNESSVQSRVVEGELGKYYDTQESMAITDCGEFITLDYLENPPQDFILPTIFANGMIINCVGEQSFNGCESIINLSVPDGYKYICSFAFMDCPNLETIYLGKDVYGIEELAFSGCNNLKQITVSEDNPYLCVINNAIVTKQDKKVLFSTGYIPQDISAVYHSALRRNEQIENISVPEGVLLLGGFSFADSSLSSVALPDSLVTIEHSAFKNTKLKEIYIPESVTKLGSSVFAGIDGLEINCEAESKPAGWDEKWLDNCTNYTINWGVTREG